VLRLQFAGVSDTFASLGALASDERCQTPSCETVL